jgi:ATP-dependent DNA ligase
VPGRSENWRKIKCIGRQDLVIGGYTEPKGTRAGFGAVLVGYYDEMDRLRYAGKVGSGFTSESLESLSKTLRRFHRKTSPFHPEDARDLPKHGVQWVTPRLVADFGFSEWPPSGKLRHPRFRGLRRGKGAKEVIREDPL